MISLLSQGIARAEGEMGQAWSNAQTELGGSAVPQHLFARGLLVGAYWKKGDFEPQLTEDLRRGEALAPNEEVRVALRDIVAEVLDVYRHSGYAEAQRSIFKHLPR